MQRNAAKLVIGMALTAIGMFGADSSLGTWKLNVAKSKSTSTNPFKSRADVYEATPDGGVKVTRTEERADGAVRKFSYTFKYDGKEYPVTGAAFDTTSAKRIDANTTTQEVKKTSGPLHQTAQHVISKDGKTKTVTVNGPDASGKNVVATYVFEKQ
jgi:hypothetical protein